MLDTVEQTLIDIRDQLTVRTISVASNCWRPIIVRPIVVLPCFIGAVEINDEQPSNSEHIVGRIERVTYHLSNSFDSDCCICMLIDYEMCKFCI
jgi:hypothetical protein